MGCALSVDPAALLAWHFGATSEDEADALEAHLATCATCLAAAFAVKRDVDRGATANGRPSRATRVRTLRAADAVLAARRVVAASPRRLAWALAAAACVVAIVWHGLAPSASPRVGGSAAPAATGGAAAPAGAAPAGALRQLEDGVDSGRAQPAPLSVL
jgi:hypothetical protein